MPGIQRRKIIFKKGYRHCLTDNVIETQKDPCSTVADRTWTQDIKFSKIKNAFFMHSIQFRATTYMCAICGYFETAVKLDSLILKDLKQLSHCQRQRDYFSMKKFTIDIRV